MRAAEKQPETQEVDLVIGEVRTFRFLERRGAIRQQAGKIEQITKKVVVLNWGKYRESLLLNDIYNGRIKVGPK